MGLGFVFKLTNFKVIFVNDVRYGSSFILLHVNIQFSQHHLLKTFFSPLSISQRSVDCICMDVFLGHQFCSIGLCVCFLCKYHTFFDYYSFIIHLKSESVMPPASLFL